MTRASGVEGGTLWYIRWSTSWRKTILWHSNGSPDALCPIFLPLAPFFWVVNVSVKILYLGYLPSAAVVKMNLQPQMKAVSLRSK